jgi:hypothetical protein
MAKIQGSDGLLGKREVAILNIDSILNNFFVGSNEVPKCLSQPIQNKFIC